MLLYNKFLVRDFSYAWQNVLCMVISKYADWANFDVKQNNLYKIFDFKNIFSTKTILRRINQITNPFLGNAPFLYPPATHTHVRKPEVFWRFQGV